MEKKTILLPRYAHYNHVGPYSLIRQSGQAMQQELVSNGWEITSPYLEIYGHWTSDETKLETELIMCLR